MKYYSIWPDFYTTFHRFQQGSKDGCNSNEQIIYLDGCPRVPLEVIGSMVIGSMGYFTERDVKQVEKGLGLECYQESTWMS